MVPSISIIVPVYNVEKYLRRCLDSILAQSFSDWECILVDDGSTDESGKICDEYANVENRFKVFHKENGGVSSARNKGIEEAIGSYIIFVDSDDCLKSNCLQVLMLRNDIPDLTIFSFDKIQANERCSTRLSECFKSGKREVLSFALQMKNDPYTSEVFCFPWNKLFVAKYIKNYDIKFPTDICLREDEIFMYRYIQKCSSISVLADSLYNYSINESGLAHRRRPPEEDVALAHYIIEESKFFADDYLFFFENQTKRALLYLFSAFLNSQSNRYAVFNAMEDIASKKKIILHRDDRILVKCVISMLKLPKPMAYCGISVISLLWNRYKKRNINV